MKGINLTINVKGLTIAYNQQGEGETPLMFIHGFPFDKSTWQPQVDYFKKSHRVIAYDIRGFGKSTTDHQEPSMSLFADDLIDLMDALQIDKAMVCGLSMGGYILLNAVKRYPERFQSIILSDTQCVADTPEGRDKRYKTIQHIETHGLNDFVEAFSKNLFYKDTFDNEKEMVDGIKQTILSTSPETVTSTMKALAAREETCSSLSKISIRALIICGKEDMITPVAQSELLHNSIRNSKMHILDHAGHLSNLEQPEEFNKSIESFL